MAWRGGRLELPGRSRAVIATARANACVGVSQPRICRGRPFSSAAEGLRSKASTLRRIAGARPRSVRTSGCLEVRARRTTRPASSPSSATETIQALLGTRRLLGDGRQATPASKRYDRGLTCRSSSRRPTGRSRRDQGSVSHRPRRRGHAVNRPGFSGGSISPEDGAVAGSKTYSRDVRERAVRMVFAHEGRHGSRRETIRSIAGKLGCANEILRRASAYFAQAELDRRPKGWRRSSTRTGMPAESSRSPGSCARNGWT